MLAEGNGTPEACSWCLLNTLRGEVPFRRDMGIDPEIFDRPFEDARADLDEAARDALAAYEPRIDVQAVEIEATEDEAASGAPYSVFVVGTSEDSYDEEE